MKKVMMVVLGIFLVSGIVYQAQAADVTYSVKVQVVSVSADWTTLFSTPTCNAGSKFNIYGASISVQNTGNVNEDFILSCANSGSWNVTSSTPGANNEFRLMALFNSIEPSSVDYDVNLDTMTTTSLTASVTRYAGDQSGNNVPQNETRGVWVSFCAPTETPVGTEQSITITIDAQSTP
ncbi:hypothetical protein KJ633_05475 [bacterium]|nr:hypothetical protein [bacterium]MBU3955892.1 hypothetical protein [bacterium]